MTVAESAESRQPGNIDDEIAGAKKLTGCPLWLRKGRIQIGEKLYVLKLDRIEITDMIPVKTLGAGYNIELKMQKLDERGSKPGNFTILWQPGTRLAELLEGQFYKNDPFLGREWDPEIWELIKNDQLKTGMTKEQVRMSWGEPTFISKVPDSRERWSYEWQYQKKYLYFENDNLVQIKEWHND